MELFIVHIVKALFSLNLGVNDVWVDFFEFYKFVDVWKMIVWI